MKISFLGLLTIMGAGLLLFYILRQAKLQVEPKKYLSHLGH